MEQHKPVVAMTTAGCFAAIMLVIALLSTYIPFFAAIGHTIMPMPITIVYMKYSLRYAIMTGVVAAVLMGIFIDPVSAIIQFVGFSIIGLTLGVGFRRQWPAAQMLISVTIALVSVAIGLMGILYATMNVNIPGEFVQAFQSAIDTTIAQSAQSGASDVQMVEVKAQLEQMRRVLPSLLPILICLAMSITAYLNIKIAQLILSRLGFSLRPFLPIRCWEIPRGMIYLYILALVSKYWGNAWDLDWLSSLALNVYGMAVFFICIQGLAFIFAILHQRFAVRTSIQVLIGVLVFIVPGVSMLPFFLGLFDMLLQYRRKHDMI